MLLLARLAALSVGIAVLMLFVLPRLVEGPQTDADGRPSDVKIAKNTTWDNTTLNNTTPDGTASTSADKPSPGPASQPSTAWGERAPTPEAEQSRDAERSSAQSAGASRLTEASPEVQRFAAIEKDHAITLKPPGRKRFYRVIVRDAGTLKTGNHIIHLQGIAVREEDETCKDEDGTSWPCGIRARAALTRLIRGRAVVCDLPRTGDEAEFTSRCRIGETDLSLWMVEQGWAKPATDTDDTFAKARDKAKEAKLGLWGGPRQGRAAPTMSEPVPVFEQEPIYEESDPLYPDSEPIYDQ
ncbi:hypothetical protein A7A08_01808 [Methyloligella halotolerans]|uniref:TNase-like domain-containing protein n=1 Tax=Methyloligella halotolerans TaxID=1177755 RepID=A0A1E2RXW2_9HYPH|nr:thermonuclease family protein [Methyloligella halotolerans]ODA67064.1 hypothetical protein A7A08_01808 [Methyloligella halotolerans]